MIYVFVFRLVYIYLYVPDYITVCYHLNISLRRKLWPAQFRLLADRTYDVGSPA